MGQTNDNIKYVITGMTVNDIVTWCKDNGFTGGKSPDGVCKIAKDSDGKTITNHYDRWHYERIKHLVIASEPELIGIPHSARAVIAFFMACSYAEQSIMVIMVAFSYVMHIVCNDKRNTMLFAHFNKECIYSYLVFM